jgi:hypothetical protein
MCLTTIIHTHVVGQLVVIQTRLIEGDDNPLGVSFLWPLSRPPDKTYQAHLPRKWDQIFPSRSQLYLIVSQPMLHNTHPCCGSAGCDSNEISVGKDNRKIAKFYDPNEEVALSSPSEKA